MKLRIQTAKAPAWGGGWERGEGVEENGAVPYTNLHSAIYCEVPFPQFSPLLPIKR